jgi:hypothetical protein
MATWRFLPDAVHARFGSAPFFFSSFCLLTAYCPRSACWQQNDMATAAQATGKPSEASKRVLANRLRELNLYKARMLERRPATRPGQSNGLETRLIGMAGRERVSSPKPL